jgi:selenide,water dikinase
MADLRYDSGPSMLVGPGDDAGVCLFGDQAIVETVDVISPVVNDPFTFGEISATNSISDVYAMGGKPVSAMAIVGFPACECEPAVIREIMRGALSVLRRAGAVLVGGHSFDNNEIKFGLSVSGTIDKNRILRAGGAVEGELLILTKPLGIGVLTTALKGGILTDAEIGHAIEWMRTLNEQASILALKSGASACTDVTGFGLLGHALNMLRDSGLDFVIELPKVPIMDRVNEMIDSGMAPGGAYSNLSYVAPKVDFGPAVTEEQKLVLADPQTSGGLLISVMESGVRFFAEAGIFYKIIGSVVKGTGRVKVE